MTDSPISSHEPATAHAVPDPSISPEQSHLPADGDGSAVAGGTGFFLDQLSDPPNGSAKEPAGKGKAAGQRSTDRMKLVTSEVKRKRAPSDAKAPEPGESVRRGRLPVLSGVDLEREQLLLARLRELGELAFDTGRDSTGLARHEPDPETRNMHVSAGATCTGLWLKLVAKEREVYRASAGQG